MQAAKVTAGGQLAITSEHDHIIDRQLIIEMKVFRVAEDTMVQK
jgi:hypothetical protein